MRNLFIILLALVLLACHSTTPIVPTTTSTSPTTSPSPQEPIEYTLVAQISGLTSTGLVLNIVNNTSSSPTTLNVPEDISTIELGSYVGDTNFSVSIVTQPTGLTCTINNGSGTIEAADDLNVSIACITTPVEGTATLTWSAPTTNTDGSELTDLAGFIVYSGLNSSDLTQIANIGSATTTTYTVNNLSEGTWYFAVVAYTSNNTQSTYSNIVSKTIQ